MFGLIGNLAKVAVGVVATPVALVVDVAEATGLKEESTRRGTHTGRVLGATVKNVENVVDPDKWL